MNVIMPNINGSMFLLAAASCLTGLNVVNFWSAPYLAWFPVVILAVLAIISILSMVYTLSPLIGRTDIRIWARVKAYELLLSIALVLVFASFSTLLCSINPTPLLRQFNLLPGTCRNSSNLYAVSVCDMYQFNNYAAAFNEHFFLLQLVISLQPALYVNLNPFVFTGGIGVSTALSAGPLELFPVMTSYKYLGVVLDALYSAVLLNQIQLLLLSSSALLFAIFMAIGLIARAFGVTRTFGGAMIAFAIGIGFVYPLLVSITYGFIDYGMYELQVSTISTLVQLSPVVIIYNIIPIIIGAIFGNNPIVRAITNTFPPSFIPSVFNYIGLISLGLIIVPLINFVIVDTFITDFSRAVGERMDFLSLLTRLV